MRLLYHLSTALTYLREASNLLDRDDSRQVAIDAAQKIIEQLIEKEEVRT